MPSKYLKVWLDARVNACGRAQAVQKTIRVDGMKTDKWQSLPCYTAVARLGFKRRANVEFYSFNLVRRGQDSSTTFETGLAMVSSTNIPLIALKRSGQTENCVCLQFLVGCASCFSTDLTVCKNFLRFRFCCVKDFNCASRK